MTAKFDELFGRYRIVHFTNIDLVNMKQTMTESPEGEALGHVEISENRLSCPLGTFAIEAIKLHPQMPAWFLKLEPSSEVLRCSIYCGKTRRRSITIDTESHMFTYSFNLPDVQ